MKEHIFPMMCSHPSMQRHVGQEGKVIMRKEGRGYTPHCGRSTWQDKAEKMRRPFLRDCRGMDISKRK